MIIVKTVKQYNREANLKYLEAVNEFREMKRSVFPFLPMYTFNLDNGERRKNGYVVSNGDSHLFFQAKELTKYINEVPNREFTMIV